MAIVIFSILVMYIFTIVVIVVAHRQKIDDELMAKKAKLNQNFDIQGEHDFLCCGPQG